METCVPTARPEIQFSARTEWIWLSKERWNYHQYMDARQTFSLTGAEACGPAELLITASSLYQVFLNGVCFGHGPAKAAAGRVSVDSWPLVSLLRVGRNELLITVLSMGVGTLTHCLAPAGLLFELRLPGRCLGSGPRTKVRPTPTRQQRSVRLWVQPCTERVAAAAAADWQPAVVVEPPGRPYARPVPPPSRLPLLPRRLVSFEIVELPNVDISFRVRPYLAGTAANRCNYTTERALIVTDVHSPVAQSMQLLPTLTSATWYVNGRRCLRGSGIDRQYTEVEGPAELVAGINRFVGVHLGSLTEDVTLAAFADHPVTFSNPFGAGAFQVVAADAAIAYKLEATLPDLDWEAWSDTLPAMAPEDTLRTGNAQDLVIHSRHLKQLFAEEAAAAAGQPLVLPPARAPQASRVILDLGGIGYGWLCFDAAGPAGGELLISLFEGVEETAPPVLQFATGCNNALSLTLTGEAQRFESFLAYGGRFIAVCYSGPEPLRLHNLQLLAAGPHLLQRGFMQCGDAVMQRLYEMCARTVATSCDDTLLNNPTIEQANWCFDSRLGSLTQLLTAGDQALPRHSLEVFAEDPDFPGLVRTQYPSTYDTLIPLQSFHWIMWCRDHYFWTADRALLAQLYPRVVAGLEQALACLNDDGLLHWENVWHLVEWGRGRDDDHAINTAEQAALVGALDAGLEMFAWHADSDTGRGQRWHAARTTLAASINDLLWDEAKQCYVDSMHADGTRSQVSSQTTNALVCLFGVPPGHRAKSLVRRVRGTDAAMLPCGSPVGIYYVMEMLDKHNQVRALFRMLRRYWGEMVSAGDQTVWETFPSFGFGPFPTRSRCHIYATYICRYLVKYVLGLRPLAPGCTRFAVIPDPVGIDHCRGAVPTPAGLIRIAWKRDGQSLIVDVEHPAALTRCKQHLSSAESTVVAGEDYGRSGDADGT